MPIHPLPMAERRERVSREQWTKRVKQWRDSGLTIEQFSSQLDINPRRLAYWKCTLNRRQAAIPLDSSSRAAPSTSTVAGAFVRLEPVVATDSRFELELSTGRKLRIPPKFDEVVLRRLIAIVEGG